MSDTEKKLTKENLKFALAEFIEKEKLSVKDVSKAIGFPAPVIGRVLWPSDNLIKRCQAMFVIGYKDYKKLSEAEKEKIGETIGAVGGVGLGVGTSLGAISTLGTVAGLSGPDIMSGLTALGAWIGGGAVAGIGVACAIPVVAAAGGYLIVKGIKSGISEAELKAEKYEPRWELPIEEVI